MFYTFILHENKGLCSLQWFSTFQLAISIVDPFLQLMFLLFQFIDFCERNYYLYFCSHWLVLLLLSGLHVGVLFYCCYIEDDDGSKPYLSEVRKQFSDILLNKYVCGSMLSCCVVLWIIIIISVLWTVLFVLRW